MRIVIDLQGAQSESRFRGIGRYSLDSRWAWRATPASHEIWLALNAALGTPSTTSAGLRRPGAARAHPRVRYRRPDRRSLRAQQPARARRRAAARTCDRAAAPGCGARHQPVRRLCGRCRGPSAASADGAATAVVLYDLIPFLNPHVYLPQPEQRSLLRAQDRFAAPGRPAAGELRLFAPGGDRCAVPGAGARRDDLDRRGRALPSRRAGAGAAGRAARPLRHHAPVPDVRPGRLRFAQEHRRPDRRLQHAAAAARRPPAAHRRQDQRGRAPAPARTGAPHGLAERTSWY
jgi:hypothetical protein